MNEQGTDGWLQERCGYATASRFGDIMASGRGKAESVSRVKLRTQLAIERLKNQPTETYKTKEMEWGNTYEPIAKQRYWLRTGNEVNDSGFVKHPTLLAGASPDGLIGDDGLIEVKCPMEHTHIQTLRTQQLPKQYFWQVHGQMWITGRQWCDFVSFDPRMPANAQLFITRVQRDEDIIEDLQGQITTFLREVEAEVLFIKNYKEGN